MENNNLPKSDDVVDLRELVLFIWGGKATICAIALSFLIMAIVYIVVVPAPVDIALEVRPISTMSFDAYTELNSQPAVDAPDGDEFEPFFGVERMELVDLLMEELVLREEIVAAIEKTGLVDRNDFQSDDDYRREVLKAAFNFRFIPPTDIEKLALQKRRASNITDYWTIKYKGPHEEKALASLEESLSSTTEVVRKRLESQFNDRIMLKRRQNEYQLADIERSRKNVIEDYDKETADRVLYLKEQAEIARSLGIAKNTIEAQSFSAGSSVVTNVQTDSPFYLKGYKAIEKEMEVMTSRDNKEAFIEPLRELDAQKRDILQSVVLERAQSAFAASPIVSKVEFKAAEYNIVAAEVEPRRKTALIILLAVALGLIVGVAIYYIGYVVKAAGSKS